jgi:hypothetical protein
LCLSVDPVQRQAPTKTQNPVQSSLGDCWPGVWRVRDALGPRPDDSALSMSRHNGAEDELPPSASRPTSGQCTRPGVGPAYEETFGGPVVRRLQHAGALGLPSHPRRLKSFRPCRVVCWPAAALCGITKPVRTLPAPPSGFEHAGRRPRNRSRLSANRRTDPGYGQVNGVWRTFDGKVNGSPGPDELPLAFLLT